MTQQMPDALATCKRLSALVAISSVAVSLALLATRTMSAISFTEPLLVITSGAEEESTFALWKYAHGFPVYADPHVPPFAASYYNWAFYGLYGAVAAAAARVFDLGSEWLPTVSRLVSLAFVIIGSLVGYLAFRPGWAPLGLHGRLLAAALAVFVFAGPLVGFWAISVNPELAATVFGLAAVVAFLSWHPTKPVMAILVASAFSYLAWSFKQSHVFAPGALTLFLCLRRDWRLAGILVVTLGSAIAVTLLAGTATYREMVLYFFPLLGRIVGAAPVVLDFDAQTLARNLSNLAIKAGPLLGLGTVLPALAWAIPSPSRKMIMGDDRLLLALCGMIISAGLAIPASAKAGASENYYFPLMAFAALTLSAAWPHLSARPWVTRVALIAFALGWTANAVACATVLAGKSGVRSVRSWHEKLVAQRSCIASTAGPRLFTQTHLAVPWINPSGPYFVYGYHYPNDRAAGHPFPEGAIQDLIKAGYFATLFVAEGSKAEFDGVSFERYNAPLSPCAGLLIYSRIAAAAW